MLVQRGLVVPVGGVPSLGAEQARKCNFGFSAHDEEEVVVLIMVVVMVMVESKFGITHCCWDSSYGLPTCWPGAGMCFF